MIVRSPRKSLPTLQFGFERGRLWFQTATEFISIALPASGFSREPSDFIVTRAVTGDESFQETFEGSECHHLLVGKDNHVRNVYHWIAGERALRGGLRVGLTVHAGSGFQSSLPHLFELEPTPDFQEVFFYMIEGGANARAVQIGTGLWHDGTSVNDAWLVGNHDFSVIPMGYHPVLAEPDTEVSYCWAYVCSNSAWEKLP